MMRKRRGSSGGLDVVGGVKERLGVIRLEPVVESFELSRVVSGFREGNLMGSPGAFHLDVAGDSLGSGPTLGRAEDDDREPGFGTEGGVKFVKELGWSRRELRIGSGKGKARKETNMGLPSREAFWIVLISL
jgi:hypothetical protein